MLVMYIRSSICVYRYLLLIICITKYDAYTHTHTRTCHTRWEKMTSNFVTYIIIHISQMQRDRNWLPTFASFTSVQAGHQILLKFTCWYNYTIVFCRYKWQRAKQWLLLHIIKSFCLMFIESPSLWDTVHPHFPLNSIAWGYQCLSGGMILHHLGHFELYIQLHSYWFLKKKGQFFNSLLSLDSHQ